MDIKRGLDRQESAVVAKEKVRRTQRKHVYLGEGLEVSIRRHDKNDHVSLEKFIDQVAGEIVDISTEGVGIAVTEEVSAMPNVMDLVTVSGRIVGYQQFQFQGIIVNISDTIFCGEARKRLGIAYLKADSGINTGAERRSSERFQTDDSLQPIAFCREAIFFQEFLQFFVVELSKNGARLRTFKKAPSLIPSLQIKLSLHIPTERSHEITATIKHLYSHEDGAMDIAVKWENPSKKLLREAANYLFFVGRASLSDLRRAGFPTPNIQHALTVDYPKAKEDWDEILLLRFQAYKAVGKFHSAKVKEAMLDKYDQHARQLMCKVKNKLVGAVRVVFVNKNREICEHEAIGVKIPEWLWQAGFVEVSRACTAENYRGGDVFLTLLRHIARVTKQAGIPYAIANCNPEMWPAYKAAGFRKVGVDFEAFGRKDCSLIYNDIDQSLTGKNMTPLAYNIIGFPIGKFLLPRLKNFKLSHRLLIWMHTVLRPIVKLIVDSLKKRNRQK